MKKSVSFILVFTLLLCFCIPAFADGIQVDVSALDGALIVHHAFDGTTDTEKKSDTATGGSSKETLTTIGSTASGVTTVSGTNTTLAYLGGGSNATAKGQDFVGNTTGEFTFYLSFRLNATDAASVGTGYCDTFTLNSTKDVRIFTSGLNATTQTADLYFLTSANGGCTSAVKAGSIPIGVGTEEKTDFIRFALTMKYDETAGTWDYIAYLSTDGGNTYTETVKKGCSGTPDFFLSTEVKNRWMKLGNVNADRPNTAQDFDDFRIYNKALTAEELKTHLGTVGAVFHGVQSTAVADGVYGVRFVGSIDSLDYSRVGFRVTAQNGAKEWDVPTTTVYDSLLGSTESGIESYTAAALRGEGSYLFALTIRNIPALDEGSGENLTVTFVVTPYTVSLDGVRTEGRSYTVVFTAGIYQPV